MGFSWTDLIAPGISAVAGLIGGNRQNATNASNVAATNEQAMYMSNTAHQREVADLRAAGLNPILSATGGSGAVTPGLQTWQANNALGQAISSARDVWQTEADTRLKEQQREKIKQEQTIDKPKEDIKDYVDKAIKKVEAMVEKIPAQVSSTAHAALDAAATPIRGPYDTAVKIGDVVGPAVKEIKDRVVEMFTSSAKDAGNVKDEISKIHFKGNYDAVMAEINRIKDPADRKAAKAQYLRQITR